MIKEFLYLIIFLTANLLLLGSCQNDETILETPTTNNEVTLTLRLPGFTTATRAVDENSITSLRVLFFKADGSYLSEKTIDPSKIVNNGNGYKIVLPIDEGTESLWLIANYNGNINITNNSSQLILTDNPNSNDNLVFFGSSTVAELSGSNNPSIALTRTCAKTTLTVEATNFTLQEVKFYGTPNQGSIAPSNNKGEPAIPAGTTYAAEGRVFTNDTPYYHYEAATGNCYLIIQGTYQGVKGFYKVGYIPEKSENNPQPKEVAILRNHHYIFIIAKVTGYGWQTEEEAVKSKPDNRMTVLLKDDDETIYNMIACKDYELGVCEDVRVAYNATTADIHIVTSYLGNPQYTCTVNYGEDGPTGWINDQSTETKVEVSAEDTHSAHTKYTLQFSVQSNENSNTERTAEIIVRSGDLSRTVKIIQEGNDLNNNDREVLIYGLKEVGTNYHEFLTDYLQGETKEEMGVARDNGLHFRICNNPYYYTIPYIDGDEKTIVEGKGKFTVEQQGNFWKIQCTDTENTDYDMWTGSFSISNTTSEGNPVSISYKVYHLGLFHQLTGGYQIDGPTNSTRKGWFYYEQVKVTGTDGETYYVLDRNMGASSNHFYSPAYVTSDGRENACGGYFKIANTKEDMTLINALPPEGYDIPEAYHLQDLGIKTKARDSYGTVTVKTNESKLAVDEIYFPLTGYMEGDLHKDEVHTCLWSRSLVAGNQGFSPTSPEYGYWFRYFDVYGSSARLGNMRIMTRAAGGADGYYKALPVRCMRGPEVPIGSDLQQPAIGRKRIFCKNVQSWTTIYIHAWIEKEGEENKQLVTTWPGLVMYKVENNYWYADIDENVTHIFFNDGTGGTGHQTKDIPLEADKDTYTNQELI